MEPERERLRDGGVGVKPTSKSPAHAIYAATMREAAMASIDSVTGCLSSRVEVTGHAMVQSDLSIWEEGPAGRGQDDVQGRAMSCMGSWW
jgi:hypothetical protein